jgi:hypothetical protein
MILTHSESSNATFLVMSAIRISDVVENLVFILVAYITVSQYIKREYFMQHVKKSCWTQSISKCNKLIKNLHLQYNDWAAVPVQWIFGKVCTKDTILKTHFLYYNMRRIFNKCCRNRKWKVAQNTVLHIKSIFSNMYNMKVLQTKRITAKKTKY